MRLNGPLYCGKVNYCGHAAMQGWPPAQLVGAVAAGSLVHEARS